MSQMYQNCVHGAILMGSVKYSQSLREMLLHLQLRCSKRVICAPLMGSVKYS